MTPGEIEAQNLETLIRAAKTIQRAKDARFIEALERKRFDTVMDPRISAFIPHMANALRAQPIED